jgi:hypothetical protein
LERASTKASGTPKTVTSAKVIVAQHTDTQSDEKSPAAWKPLAGPTAKRKTKDPIGIARYSTMTAPSHASGLRASAGERGARVRALADVGHDLGWINGRDAVAHE